jgi:spermidine synthase
MEYRNFLCFLMLFQNATYNTEEELKIFSANTAYIWPKFRPSTLGIKSSVKSVSHTLVCSSSTNATYELQPNNNKKKTVPRKCGYVDKIDK